MVDLRRLFAALLLVLGAAAGCSSDAPAKKADGPGCNLPARFDPFHDSRVVVSDGGQSFQLRDPRTNSVVAECPGALVASGQRYMTAGKRATNNDGYNRLRVRTAVAPFRLVPSDVSLFLLNSVSTTNEYQSPNGTLTDLTTGDDTRVPAASGNRFVLAVAGERVVVGRRSAGPHPPRADDFCILPSPTAPATACAPIAGARGTGIPAVHADGSVGWASSEVVPARFGSLRGWATTDGTVITSFSRFLPGSSSQSLEHTAISPDGLSFAYAWDDGHLSWGVVRSVTAAGVTGTGYSSPHVEDTEIDRHGMSVSADGTALVATTSYGRVFRVHDGSAKVDTLKPFGPSDYGDRYLVHWPDATS